MVNSVMSEAKLEIIVETVADAVAAEAGGATQLDLKSDFAEGGLTATTGMAEAICSRVQIDVILMIRPHARSMSYSAEDINVMCTDIRLARERGVQGFLLGANTTNDLSGELDLEAIHAFQEAAGDIPLNAHMFWLATRERHKTLEQLIELGFRSVRTSGGVGMGKKAPDWLPEIRAQQEWAAGRIDLFLAGGVSAANIGHLVAGTGVFNAHAGSSVRIPEGPTGVVVEEKVRALRKALDNAVVAYSAHSEGKS